MKNLSLSDAQITAKKRKWKMFFTQYINAKSPLKWKCKEGHVWLAPLTRIKDRGVHIVLITVLILKLQYKLEIVKEVNAFPSNISII